MLQTGIQVVHKQQAMQLIRLSYDSPTRECWLVKFLFVDKPDGYEWFMKGEQPKPLHTNHARTRITTPKRT